MDSGGPVLREALQTEARRSDYLLAMKRGVIPWDETELCLKLLWQRSSNLPAPFATTYETLEQGGFDTPYAMAEAMAPGVERYCLNVRLDIKPDRLDDFKAAIAQNEAGTRLEPKNIKYSWGESATDANSFHFQEQFCGEPGFNAHASSSHFATWEKFAATQPFAQEPKVEFWNATTNLAHEAPPCVVAAAVLATLDFVELGL